MKSPLRKERPQCIKLQLTGRGGRGDILLENFLGVVLHGVNEQ